MESTGAGRASGTASRTRASRGGSLSRRRARRAGWRRRGGCPRRRPARAPRSPWVTRVAAPERTSSCTPCGLGTGHRAGHPHQVAVEAGRPARGVEGTAADRRLDDHRPAGEGGDQPVAAEEPAAGGCAPGRDLGDDRRRPAEMVEQVAVGDGVGAVGPAGEHRDVGAVDGEGAAVGGLVDAERCSRTPPDGRPAPGRRRCRRPPRCRRSWPSGTPTTATAPPSRSSRVGPFTQSPSGGPPRWSSSSARIRSSIWVGHSSSPGTT